MLMNNWAYKQLTENQRNSELCSSLTFIELMPQGSHKAKQKGML